MKKKVLMHIECLRGTGELTMASRVADALAQQGVEVIVTSGSMRQYFDHCHRNVRKEPLPAIWYDDKHAKDYLTEDGRLLRDAPNWLENRAAQLIKLFDKEKPDALLICYWPFGNGQGVLDHEMHELVAHARKENAKLPICGLIREVLYVDSHPRKNSPVKAARYINNHFNHLFVHGDENFIPLKDTYNYAKALASKITYTGYVTSPPPPEKQGLDKNLIIINAGGADYRPSSAMVLEKAIKSLKYIKPDFLKGKKIRILVGKSFDAVAYQHLEQVLAQEMPTLSRLGVKKDDIDMGHTLASAEYHGEVLPHCALYIGQAGIATVLDIMAHHFPAVLVPVEERVNGYNFKEQLIRARKLAEKDVIGMVRQPVVAEQGGEEILADRVNSIIVSKANKEALNRIRCDGANNTANYICSMLGMDGYEKGVGLRPSIVGSSRSIA